MPPLKRLSVFFFWCALVYALLVIPWPGLLDGYRVGFRTYGNALFRSIPNGGAVSFEPLSSGDHAADTTLVLKKRTPPYVRGKMDIPAVYLAYRPTVFLIALVLATPIPWSRRWGALFWGFLWVNVFIAFRLSLHVLDVFSGDNALAIYTLTPFWKGMLGIIIKIVVIAPENHYIAPAFIWILVAFRRGEWRTAFGLEQPSNPAPVDE